MYIMGKTGEHAYIRTQESSIYQHLSSCVHYDHLVYLDLRMTLGLIYNK